MCVSGLEFLWWRKQVLAQRPRWSLLAISFPYSCSKIRTVNLPHCLIHQPPHPHQHTHIPITHTHTYSSPLARTSAHWLQSIWTQKEKHGVMKAVVYYLRSARLWSFHALDWSVSGRRVCGTSCRPPVLQEVFKCWQESCGMACGNREDGVRPERSSAETHCIRDGPLLNTHSLSLWRYIIC